MQRARGRTGDLEPAPRVALVAALPDLPVGEAGEQAPVCSGERVRHRVQRLRQPAGERAPLLAAAAAEDAGLWVATAVRGERPGAGAHVPDLGIVWVDGDSPGVIAIASLVGGLPRVAAVIAEGGAAPAGFVRAAGDAGMPGERVNVALGAWSVILPACTSVGGAHQPAELDPDEQQVGVVGARRDPSHVRRPRSRREAPGWLRRELEQGIQRLPAPAAVAAAEQPAGLAACVDGSVDGTDCEREHLGGGESTVDPGPASVGGAANTAGTKPGIDDVQVGRVRCDALGAATRKRGFGRPRSGGFVDPHDRVARCGVDPHTYIVPERAGFMRRPEATMTARDGFPARRMDRTPLATLVDIVRAHERFEAFANALPARARVSEPLLPLLLAALHERLERALLVLLPEDADARDAAEAASWYLGSSGVALLPSRGVRLDSGLEPPPHLVGERARALAVLGQGGLVCASALALSEGLPPLDQRPSPTRLAVGEEPGLEGLAEALALGGYARVERAEERGQFAVRGGILDVFPSTGREPLRVEFFGDEIEAVRAFSPFTQRALRPVDEAVVFPAAERRLDVVESLAERPVGDGGPVHLVPPVERPPDFVWQPDDVRGVLDDEGLPALDLSVATELDPFPRGQAFRFEAQRPAIAARGLAEAENELAAFLRGGNRVVVAFPHRGEALRQKALLRRVEPELLEAGERLSREAELRFAVSTARRGFVWRELGLVLLPDTQVFRKRPPRADARLGRALASFADLRTGDFVVHEDHGVGKLLGFETKEVAAVTRDYLLVAFRGDDRLYLPHEQLGKLSKYIGADAKAPQLSKLGGKAWANLKARARASVRELAGELLALYARRERAPGVAFNLDDDLLEQLESSFPYRETEDQERAIEAVKEDLEAPHPMDRLVCGDVGFGKTEVAVRAAFAAAVNGKQTLFLCPTTILAEQHWNTFRERYRDMPVTVEMVSRFRRPSEAKRVLADFTAGKIDVLIGTHRILSRDVIPKELGLVILDEEQRFGVAQKELLRSLRLEVDVLALSATPIPRTLHMSLSGLRDISIIETPPEGRRPIRTTVGEYDEELIKVALEREHARGGQAFYLHNRVETIEEAATKLRELSPSLRFLVAHGQMRERGLEERMHSFLAGDADVLVSTTIIESGIDIPQANTLIVERADTLGLSQLYQIRGRVGRSDVTAHAYLFYPDARELTAEARARLATLADHTELGAGFQIAMRDLEIRGAGDLLGAEQSGHVAAMGFELYVEMLNEAVAELSGEARVVARPVRVDARVDAYVPATYIASEVLKIDLHRRLALVESDDELRELRAAIDDRYGPPPAPVENLFAIQEAKLKLARVGADYLVFRGGRATVGPVSLGSGELRALRTVFDTAVYSTARREVSRRADDLEAALALADAIVEARLAA
jgi:transcription-repair coupling factor (superfamily II helicase)